jgi:hypothetical protein
VRTVIKNIVDKIKIPASGRMINEVRQTGMGIGGRLKLGPGLKEPRVGLSFCKGWSLQISIVHTVIKKKKKKRD